MSHPRPIVTRRTGMAPLALLLLALAACAPTPATATRYAAPASAHGKRIKPLHQHALSPATEAQDAAPADAATAPVEAPANSTDSGADGRALARASGQIRNHGGPVMTGTVTAYLIWYGNWAGNSAVSILTDFVSTLRGSPFYNIQTTYPGVTNNIQYGGSWSTPAIYGNSISDANIFKLVTTAITTAKLPLNTNGVYFVLTSAEVTASSGFCSDYCAWHWYGTLNNQKIKYSYVGNPETQCLSGCGTQGNAGPNGNPGADAMATSLAHELNEAVTDPLGTGWYFDNNGDENADRCVGKLGATYTAPNGARANVKLGKRDFLLEQNWANTIPAGSCRSSYP